MKGYLFKLKVGRNTIC